MKVFDLAKELGVKTKVVLETAKRLGLSADHHMDVLSGEDADTLTKAVQLAKAKTLEADLPEGHEIAEDGKLAVPEGSKIGTKPKYTTINYLGEPKVVKI